jgi:NAD(P)-dependent dehydrogenase (short-subunit alcohol dehydrogenase family)
MNNIVIFGATGAIGNAILYKLAKDYPNANISAFSQQEVTEKLTNVDYGQINYDDESSINAISSKFEKNLDLVFVATGILHTQDLSPEKSLKQISSVNFQSLFKANTIFPALVAKYFIPKLNNKYKSILAVISARVGSISDNKLGGWYAYRMSKAALNMFVKTASIETKRLNNRAIIVALHPGTVESKLSKPFQSRVSEGKLFSAEYSADKLLQVLDGLKINDTGKCFAWDAQEIPA